MENAIADIGKQAHHVAPATPELEPENTQGAACVYLQPHAE